MLTRRPSTLFKIFRSFPQSLKLNAQIVPSIRLQFFQLHSIQFAFHYRRIIRRYTVSKRKHLSRTNKKTKQILIYQRITGNKSGYELDDLAIEFRSPEEAK
jgi:hypothetical protein